MGLQIIRHNFVTEQQQQGTHKKDRRPVNLLTYCLIERDYYSFFFFFKHLILIWHVAGRDWRQEEKGTTEDDMAGWHHWLDGHESGWTLGVGDGQGSLACCDSWGRKESDMTEWQNWTEVNWLIYLQSWHFLVLNLPANLENSAVATGLEKVSFHSNPKERQCQRMLKLPHNCTHLTR